MYRSASRTSIASSRRSRGSRHGSLSGSMMDLHGEEGKTRRCCNKCTRGILLFTCLALTIVGVAAIGFGIFTADWFTVDASEYGQQWQMGLWRFCRRGAGENEVGITGFDANTWTCDVKNIFPSFLSDSGRVALLDQSMWKQTKHFEHIILTLLVVAFLSGIISMFSLCCAYCNRIVPYCILVTNLIAMLASLVAVGLYFVSFQSIESRQYFTFNQVTRGVLGWSFYITVLGALSFLTSFVLTIPITVLSFAWSQYKKEKHADEESMVDIDPSRNKLIGDVYNNQPIIIERDPDTQSIRSVSRLEDMDDETRTAIVDSLSRQGSVSHGAARINRADIANSLNRNMHHDQGQHQGPPGNFGSWQNQSAQGYIPPTSIHPPPGSRAESRI